MSAGEVFGPDRPMAAALAIAELAKLEADLPTWPHEPSRQALERVRAARANRALYPEYGDTFRGH